VKTQRWSLSPIYCNYRRLFVDLQKEIRTRFNAPPLVAVPGVVVFGVDVVKADGAGGVLVSVSVLGVDVLKAGGVENVGVLVGVSGLEVDVDVTVFPIGVVWLPPPPPPSLVSGI
jgi:hypothetical protein